MMRSIDDLKLTVPFDHKELKLLHQLLSHDEQRSGEAWLLGENIDQKISQALDRYQRIETAQQFEYQLTVQTISKTLTVSTRVDALAKLWQTILQLSEFDTWTHLSGAQLGQQLAWFLKQLADNQSYRNRDNWLGTVDDWLQNFDLTWQQVLSGNVNNSYPHVNWLVYLWDWIISVDDRPHTSINMHDSKLSDQQFLATGKLLFDQNELLYHLNEPQTKFKLVQTPLNVKGIDLDA